MDIRSWSPPATLIGLAAALGLITGVLTVLAILGITPGTAIDPPGRVLLGVATVLLAGLAAHGALVRPRLTADGTGVTVRGLSGTRSWHWQSLRYRIRYTSRLGRKLATLELDGLDTDGAEHLAVLGRIDLGTDPVEVLSALDELRAL